jgi:hypothetical protein
MSRLSRPPRLLLALTSFCSGAALASVIVILGAAQAGVSRAPHLASVATSLAPLLSRDELDLLRADAVLGNSDASAELAVRLLDRFDADGDKDALYEAVQWIARDWDQPAYVRSTVIDRMVASHCDRPVLQWHWLCGGGD